jgi:hypothetical protein
MSAAVNQQLKDNIAIILKKSLAADATLIDLRANGQAKFKQIFKQQTSFACVANTFQPYVQELADDFYQWQQTEQQTLLITLVKKMELLFNVLQHFEQSHSI